MGDEQVKAFYVSDDWRDAIGVYRVTRFEVFNPWEADTPAVFVHEADALKWAKKLARREAKQRGCA